MTWWRQIVYVLRQLHRGRADRELEEEIQAHLELEAQEQVEAGVPRREAEYAAHRTFGNVNLAKEESRRVWGFAWLEALGQDLRYAVRGMRRERVVTAVAVLSLAFGIGANTSVYSLVDAVLFRPLPGLSNPGRLVSLYGDRLSTPGPDWAGIAYPDYLAFRARGELFADLAAYGRFPFNLTTATQTERLIGEVVSGSYFATLGTGATLGRTLQPEDDQRGAPPVAVISRRLWQGRFGSAHGVLGRMIELNGQPVSVVGVAEPDFHGVLLDWMGRPDVWVPLSLEPSLMGRDLLATRVPWLMSTGRLRAGIRIEQAKATLNGIARQIEHEHPETNKDRGITVIPTTDARFWPGHRRAIIRFLSILLAVVALVLLIVCANVGSLLLARATSRRREIAVRLAIGASRGRLVRQLLTESGLLAVAGAALGLLFAWRFLRLYSYFRFPLAISINLEPHLDVRVLTFTVVLSVLTTLAAGLIPALKAPRASLVRGLRDVISTWDTDGHGLSLRKVLLVTQISLSAVVLIAASLFLESLRHLQSLDPGFPAKRLLIASVDPGLVRLGEGAAARFYDQLLARARSLPGVGHAALADDAPISGMLSSVPVEIPGSDSAAPPIRTTVFSTHVSPGYFQTLGLPVLRGGELDGDHARAKTEVVINETMAARFWPGRDPLGRELKIEGRSRQVVGVVKDSKYGELWESSRPALYLPWSDFPDRAGVLLLRVSSDHIDIARALRLEARTINPRVAIFGFLEMEQHLQEGLSGERLAATLTSVLGAGALLLTGAGIFGLMSFIVTQGRREIGIRLALGAEPGQIARQILGQGLRLCVVGVVLGLVTAIGLTRFIGGLLHGTKPADPGIFAAIAVLVIMTALLACYAPVRRAAKVDPARTLRHE